MQDGILCDTKSLVTIEIIEKMKSLIDPQKLRQRLQRRNQRKWFVESLTLLEARGHQRP